MKLQCCSGMRYSHLRFESSVISYGSEAVIKWAFGVVRFESSVISYGSEAV